MPPKTSASSSKKKLRSALKSANAGKPQSAASASRGAVRQQLLMTRPRSSSSKSQSHKRRQGQAAGTIHGRGAYEWVKDSQLKQLNGDSVGGSIGGAAGRLLGSESLGRGVGNLLHKGFRWLTGRGSYKERMAGFERAHGAKLNLLDGSVPEFGMAHEYVEVAWRERFAQVVGSVNFVNTPYSINPGLSNMFPFLCTMASQYEQYSFQGCVVQFKTTCTPYASSTPSLGMVCMATKYGSQEKDEQSMEAALNSEYSTSSVPTASFMHAIECDPKQGTPEVKYVRTAAVADYYLNQSDQGVLQVCTQGQAADGQQLGDLWVTYKVRFYKPQLASVGRNLVAHYRSTYHNSNANVPFDNAVASAGSNLPLTFVGGGICMPKTPGTYLLSVYCADRSINLTQGMALTAISTDITPRAVFTSPGAVPLSAIASSWFSSQGTSIFSYAFDYAGSISATTVDISLSVPLSANTGDTNVITLDLFLVPVTAGMAAAWEADAAAQEAERVQADAIARQVRVLLASGGAAYQPPDTDDGEAWEMQDLSRRVSVGPDGNYNLQRHRPAPTGPQITTSPAASLAAVPAALFSPAPRAGNSAAVSSRG